MFRCKQTEKSVIIRHRSVWYCKYIVYLVLVTLRVVKSHDAFCTRHENMSAKPVVVDHETNSMQQLL